MGNAPADGGATNEAAGSRDREGEGGADARAFGLIGGQGGNRHHVIIIDDGGARRLGGVAVGQPVGGGRQGHCEPFVGLQDTVAGNLHREVLAGLSLGKRKRTGREQVAGEIGTGGGIGAAARGAPVQGGG
jgi:hypothetical protein